MKKRLFALAIEEQREAIRARLDRCRIKYNPVCHLLVADDDYDALLVTSLQAYEINYGIKLVPMREMVAHKTGGHCKSFPIRENAL